MKRYACNYAIIRLQPYREGGEFVNIGIVLTCAPLGYFNYALETRRTKRVRGFFPSLDSHIYRDGLKALDVEMSRIFLESGQARGQNRLWIHEIEREEWTRRVFEEFVRPREAFFYTSSPRTVLTSDPDKTLADLFARYVRQMYPEKPVSPDESLRRQMEQSLRAFHLDHLYAERTVGNEEYNVRLPFVASAISTPVDEVAQAQHLRAIKPLNLDRAESRDIYEAGDDWLARVRRLSDTGWLPGAWLFPIQFPSESNTLIAAASSIQRELDSSGVQTVDIRDQYAVRKFASLPEKIRKDSTNPPH